MRVLKYAIAMSLSAGLVLTAGPAFADDHRLDRFFFGDDEKCDSADESITNFGEVDLSGDGFGALGYVEGTGTGDDFVQIYYDTDGVNQVNVNSKSGTVSQKKYSELCVFIASDFGRSVDACYYPEKCAVKGSVNVKKPGTSDESIKVSTSANCSGTDLYDSLTSDQVTSILAAFPSGNKCGIKIKVADPGKKSSISIKMNDKDGGSGEVNGF